MEKGQMLESEIQTAIKKAHEAVKSHAQISVATASHSEFVAHPSPPIVLQGSLNPASPLPPSQSAHSSQGEAGVPQHEIHNLRIFNSSVKNRKYKASSLRTSSAFRKHA